MFIVHTIYHIMLERSSIYGIYDRSSRHPEYHLDTAPIRDAKRKRNACSITICGYGRYGVQIWLDMT